MDTPGKPSKRYPTDDVIEALIRAGIGDLPEQQRHLYRDALLGLVKLAKAELLLEMQLDFNKCTRLPN